MKIDILASGSTGNCIALTSGDKTILIDAGVPKTKIEKRLLEVGIEAPNILGICVTHAHGDHIKGLPLANKWRIPVFATDGEWKGISGVDEGLQHTIGMLFGRYDTAYLENFCIYSFKSHHDAYEPVGYTVTDGSTRTSICLDTGKVDADMITAMAGSNAYIFEANHDPDMVEQNEKYPSSVKSRILSDIGHLSNDQTAEALQKLVRGKGERIYLTHLSSSNNKPALAAGTIKRALRQKGFEEGKHYFLEVL